MILITGALGKIGRHLEIEALRPTRRELDITDHLAVRDFLQTYKPEVIVHLASLVAGECDRDRAYSVKANIEATDNLYKRGLDCGVKKFIFLSTSAIYNQKELKPTREDQNISPRNFYGETKLRAELRLNCGRALILRLFNVYGRGFDTALLNRLIRQDRIELRNPDHFWRDYIHISEAIKVIEEATTNDAEGTINLGTGVARSTGQVIEYLQQIGIFPNVKITEGEGTITWADITKLKQNFTYIPKPDIILL